MKKYIIAIPQNKEMEDDYQNGWEIETSLIEKLNLKEDELFYVYTKFPEKTEYISIPSEVFRELDINEVWETINKMDTNALIDTYEEAEIRNKNKLVEVENFLNSIKENFSDETTLVVNKIILLIRKAIRNNVGVYFFF